MSRKILRTEQIGPSGHKNEYHIGVLHGNWQEERSALGRQAGGAVKFEGTSETKSKFAPRESADAKPPRSFATECPRELLFGQSSAMGMKPEDQWVTNAQLSWGVGTSATAKAKHHYVGRLDVKGASSASASVAQLVPASEILGGSKHLHTTAGDKMRERQRDLDDDNAFMTTKQQSLDVTGDRVLRGEVAISPRDPKVARARGGAITNTLHTAANKIQLRK